MRTLAKLAQWVAPEVHPSIGTLKNQAKTVRINCVRTLENSQKLIAIKSTLNQEKIQLKNSKKLRCFFLHLYHPLLGSSLEDGSLLYSMEFLSVVPQWADKPYSQRIVFMYSTVSGSYLKTDTKCVTLFCLTKNPRVGKRQTFHKAIAMQMNNLWPVAKDYSYGK